MDTEMVRLLHAAGERKEEISEGIIRRLKAQTDIQRMLSASNDSPLESNIDQRLQHLSDIALQYLSREASTLCLKDICRRTIREHLLQMCLVNLFVRVPHLGLPSSLAKYLLYDVSLDSQ